MMHEVKRGGSVLIDQNSRMRIDTAIVARYCVEVEIDSVDCGEGNCERS